MVRAFVVCFNMLAKSEKEPLMFADLHNYLFLLAMVQVTNIFTDFLYLPTKILPIFFTDKVCLGKILINVVEKNLIDGNI